MSTSEHLEHEVANLAINVDQLREQLSQIRMLESSLAPSAHVGDRPTWEYVDNMEQRIVDRLEEMDDAINKLTAIVGGIAKTLKGIVPSVEELSDMANEAKARLEVLEAAP